MVVIVIMNQDMIKEMSIKAFVTVVVHVAEAEIVVEINLGM